MPMTKKEFSELVAEAQKEGLAAIEAKLADMTKDVDAIKAKQAEKAAETKREHTQDLMSQTAPAYLDRAKQVIARDKQAGVGLRAARFIRAVAAAKISNETPESVAKAWGDKDLADQISFAKEAQLKALAAGTLASGGALIPESMAGEVIELLRSTSVMRKAGVRQIDIPSGNLTLPRQSASATAAYVGENANISSSQMSTDALVLAAKKLAAITAVSNDLLRSASPTADQLVRDDLSQAMGLKEDITFLRGDGTQNTPKGVKNLLAPANSNAQTGVTNAAVHADYLKAMRLPESANVPMRNPFWVMTSITKYGLMQILDGNGNRIFFDELLGGTFFGKPMFVSNQIPTNLGGGTETEVFYNEGSELVIADQLMMAIEVFPGGAYHDGSAVISGISQDQTVIRAISAHDFGMRHTEAASIVTAVTLGV